MIRVTQFSDLHFSTTGERSHGGFGYDVDVAWDRIFEDAFDQSQPTPDLVVLTGDIADHGLADEYIKAAEKLERVPVAMNSCPGNHDLHQPFESHLPRPGLTMSRTLRVGNWLFLFADSNHSGKEPDASGRLIDKAERMHSAPALGAAETAWLHDTIAETDADYAFVWVHHPPGAPGAYTTPEYDAEIARVAASQPKLRGVGAGHTHTDSIVDVGGVDIHTCPAFTINIDYEANTLLPPGYRTYEFGDDGSVTSTCRFVEDETQWPRNPLPEATVRMFKGEITWDEMLAELS